jgi:hypothetical protein
LAFYFSIGIEPLYPKLCDYEKKVAVDTSSVRAAKSSKLKSLPSLINISTSMNTLSCGLNLNRDNMCMLPPLMSLVVVLFLNITLFRKYNKYIRFSRLEKWSIRIELL